MHTHRITQLAILVIASLHLCSAQWLNYPAPGVPRTKDGKVNLTAKMPRTRDGKPDLSGVWHVKSESAEEKVKLGNRPDVFQVPGMESFTTSIYAGNIVRDLPPGDIVLTPAAEAVLAARNAIPPSQDNKCLPFGMPRTVLLSEVHKIIQTPGLTLIMLELDSQTRQIYTDGRPLPQDPSPSWQGYSVGHWEKDTFVVETIGFNGKTMLDSRHPTSPAMKMTERYTRRDVRHLEHQMTFEDPTFYNKPITFKVTHLLQPDTDILEYVCAENEKDAGHLP